MDLWKWFIDDAAKIKDRTWVMATFFYMALGGLLEYVGNNMASKDNNNRA